MIPICRHPGCTSTYAGEHTWHVPIDPSPDKRRIKGCTCASGARGESCTLDCKAPAWRK